MFLFPMLLDDIWEAALLFGVAGPTVVASVVTFVVTLVLGIEPRGRSLDEVSGALAPEIAPRPVLP